MLARKSALVLVLSAGVAGCASKPVVPDSTPQSPTAVIEEHMTSNGIKGYFPFESDDTRYVRPAMKRDDSMFKGTGTFSGIFVGTHNGTKIYRVDRNLLWTLNTDKEQYTECPLRGCPVQHAPREKPQAAPKEQQPPQARREPGCTMRVAKSKFTVTETGKKQTLNGFDTSEYQLAWIVTLRDNRSRTTTSKLDVDLWTTPLTASMREAMDTEAAYARAYARATEEPSPFAKAGKPQILPSQANKLIMSYMAGLLKQGEHSALFEAGREVEKIKGHPILTKITWDMEGNACAPKEESRQSRSESSPGTPSGAGGLASGLVGMFAKREASKSANEAAGEPILSFSVEVRQLKMAPMHDGLFSVPANYKRVEPN